MEGNTQHHPFNEKFQRLKRKYDKAYVHINQALTLDEQRRPQEAVDNYVKGMRYMNCALDLWSGLCSEYPKESLSSNMGPKMDKLTVNLSKAQRRVDELLGFLDSTGNRRRASETACDPPPSYHEALAQQNRRQRSVGDEVNAMKDATLLFLIEGGVQIYFIASDGSVSAPSYPSSLAVYQFADSSVCRSTADSPPAFLQVGDWIYPLVPSVSPALHADWGAYVFPDVTAREPGCYVGIIIPDTLDAAKRQKLEEIFKKFTSFQEQAESGTGQAAEDTTGVISKGIITASEWISWGVTKGAEKAGQWVKAGSEKLRQHMEPQNEASKIDPRVQKGAECARTVTGGAVKISGFLVDKVGQATSALAKTMAPHVRRTSEAILPTSWTAKNPSDGRSTTDKISEVATSGLKGFSTVYIGLERSAMILAKSVADQTVQTVQYKYGDEAGQLTDNVVYSATNVVAAVGSMNRLGAAAVAKQVAKETASETVKYQGPHSNDPKQPGAQKSAPDPVDHKKPDANRHSKAEGGHTNAQSKENGHGHNRKSGAPPDDKKKHPPT